MKKLLDKISDKMAIMNFIYSDAKDMDIDDLKDLKDLISEAIKNKEVDS